MAVRSTLLHTCSTFNGKDTLPLEALALEHEGDAGYLDAVFGVAEKPASEMESIAATWLLLRRFRKDADGAQAHADRLAGLLPGAVHHDARLHVIQCLDRAAGGFNAPARTRLAKTLRPDLEHDRPFVRAWALSVLARLAMDTPTIRGWVGEAIEDAEENGKASLKARVRQLRCAGALEWYD